MAFNFPTSPLDGQDFTPPGGPTYTWSASSGAWVMKAVAAGAPLASPVFTGNPTAPTPSPGDNDTSIATTAFVTAAITAALAAVARGAPGDIRWAFDNTPQTWETELDGKTIAGGVALYPAVASRYPWMVSGADLKIPDYRGMFPRIWAHGRTTDPDRGSRFAQFTGAPTGDNPASVQDHGLGSHSHLYNDYYSYNDGTLQISPGAGYSYGNPASYYLMSASTFATGGNETRPINVYMSAFMRLT